MSTVAPPKHGAGQKSQRIACILKSLPKLDKVHLCSVAPEVIRTSLSSKVAAGSYIPSSLCSIVLISYRVHDNEVTDSACAIFQLQVSNGKPSIRSTMHLTWRGNEEEQEMFSCIKTSDWSREIEKDLLNLGKGRLKGKWKSKNMEDSFVCYFPQKTAAPGQQSSRATWQNWGTYNI